MNRSNQTKSNQQCRGALVLRNVILYVQRLIINAIHSRKINDARYTLEPLERDAPRRDQKPLRSSQRDVI